MKIYAAHSASGLVKIGKSHSPAERLKALQCQTDFALSLVATTDQTDEFTETVAKRALRCSRRNGEWFAISKATAKAALTHPQRDRLIFLSTLTDRQYEASGITEAKIRSILNWPDATWADFVTSIPEFRGRPVAAEPLKKRYFRATDAQWDLFTAASSGNVGQWIRDTCLRAAKRKLK